MNTNVQIEMRAFVMPRGYISSNTRLKRKLVNEEGSTNTLFFLLLLLFIYYGTSRRCYAFIRLTNFWAVFRSLLFLPDLRNVFSFPFFLYNKTITLRSRMLKWTPLKKRFCWRNGAQFEDVFKSLRGIYNGRRKKKKTILLAQFALVAFVRITAVLSTSLLR